MTEMTKIPVYDVVMYSKRPEHSVFDPLLHLDYRIPGMTKWLNGTEFTGNWRIVIEPKDDADELEKSLDMHIAYLCYDHADDAFLHHLRWAGTTSFPKKPSFQVRIKP